MKKFRDVDIKIKKEVNHWLIEYFKAGSDIGDNLIYDRGILAGCIKGKLAEKEIEYMNIMNNDFLILGAWLHWNGIIEFLKDKKKVNNVERGYV